jgi:predicted RNase H-like HicB family nuclease
VARLLQARKKRLKRAQLLCDINIVEKFTIVFTECEEGGYSAQIKEVPGAISQGETVSETVENVFDALSQILIAQVEEEINQKTRREFPLEVEFAL